MSTIRPHISISAGKAVICVFFCLIVACNGRLWGQAGTPLPQLEKAAANIGKAISESLEWYDIPIAYAYLFPSAFRPGSDDLRLRTAPFEFEIGLQTNLGLSGRKSLGSIHKDMLPNTILLLRAAICLGLNVIDEHAIDYKDYQHIIAMYKAMIYTHALTELVKNWTYRLRPDGSEPRSFFSGHTSTTFTWAAFLHREINAALDSWQLTAQDPTWNTVLKAVNATSLYGWAAYVGYSRMRDNKHYLTDVLVGAAVGTLIGNLVYEQYFSDNGGLQPLIRPGFADGIPQVRLSFSL